MTHPLSVAQALQGLRAQGLSSLTAQRLLLRALGEPLEARAWLLSHDHHILPTHQRLALQAMAVAQFNANALGLPLRWALGHWWDALPDTLRFDLVVSNPPYIAQGDSHLTALSAEPVAALVAGHDGLDDIRRIVAGARPRLRAGAWLLLEHGHDQAQAVANLLQAQGFHTVTTRHDMAGRPRCTGAQSPG